MQPLALLPSAQYGTLEYAPLDRALHPNSAVQAASKSME